MTIRPSLPARPARLIGPPLLLAVLMGACAEEAGDNNAGKAQVTASEPPSNVYARACSPYHVEIGWESQSGGSGDLQVQRRTGGNPFKTIAVVSGDRRYFVDIGLTPAAVYDYRVGASPGGEPAGYSGEVQVELPAGVLPRPQVRVIDPMLMQKGVTMFNLEDYDNLAEIDILATVDAEGRYLWAIGGARESRFVFDFEFLPNGHLIVINQFYLEEISLCGDRITRFSELQYHHDFDPTPWGTILGLSALPVKRSDGIQYLTDILVELDIENKKEKGALPVSAFIPENDACPICTYHTLRALKIVDWTHSNAIILDPDFQHIYLSVRNLNRIYKLAYPSGKVDWVMGDGGDFGQGLFSHQHEPVLLAPDRILLFDNGMHRPGGQEYSRVIEIEYDETDKKAGIVWEYRETPDFYTDIGGDADRLPNGNTLISDSMNGRIIEVTPDKVPVWELKMPYPYVIYHKAVRLESFPP